MSAFDIPCDPVAGMILMLLLRAAKDDETDFILNGDPGVGSPSVARKWGIENRGYHPQSR